MDKEARRSGAAARGDRNIRAKEELCQFVCLGISNKEEDQCTVEAVLNF